MDVLAARLGMDPAELRRRNVIEAGALPYETPTGASYDSGDYGGALDRVLEAAGYERLRAEQAARRAGGGTRQMGIGLCCYVEWTGFGSERASCSFGANWDVTVVAGTIPQGQGHETAFAQVVFDTLGVPHERVRVVHSDTHRAPGSAGTSGSRTVQVGGSAVLGAARETLEKGRRVAAHLLEADPADLVVVPGSGLGVAGDPGAVLSWAELARAARNRRKRPPGMPPGLDGESRFATPDATYPFGAHLAVVEVDTETGAVTLARYVAVDDAGRIVDHQRADGQVHGGIAQGVAQALLEEMAFDADGNCLTGSLVSYCMPSAAELPAFETSRTETPTPRNPLGAKGIGESGTIAATPAVWNAVVDALAHLGVTHVDIPATPQRVWQAIRDARGAGNPSNTVGP
jgi:aerobic carbon-monoxide dehydrogenase large subunit